MQVPRATISGSKIRKNASHTNGPATRVSGPVDEPAKWGPGAVHPKQCERQVRYANEKGSFPLHTMGMLAATPRSLPAEGILPLVTPLRVDFLYNGERQMVQ